MACPFFYPVERLTGVEWSIPPRTPLGDAYSGECRAGSEPFQPEETRLRETCNFGYGRGHCERFSPSSPSDAVRFHIAADSGDSIRIQYVREKDCWPQETGVLDCSAGTRTLAAEMDDKIIERQALAFLESYLRRRG